MTFLILALAIAVFATLATLVIVCWINESLDDIINACHFEVIPNTTAINNDPKYIEIILYIKHRKLTDPREIRIVGLRDWWNRASYTQKGKALARWVRLTHYNTFLDNFTIVHLPGRQ